MYAKYQLRTQPLLTHSKWNASNSLSASISTGRRWAIWKPTCWPWTALFTQSRGQMLPSQTDINTLKTLKLSQTGWNQLFLILWRALFPWLASEKPFILPWSNLETTAIMGRTTVLVWCLLEEVQQWKNLISCIFSWDKQCKSQFSCKI